MRRASDGLSGSALHKHQLTNLEKIYNQTLINQQSTRPSSQNSLKQLQQECHELQVGGVKFFFITILHLCFYSYTSAFRQPCSVTYSNAFSPKFLISANIVINHLFPECYFLHPSQKSISVLTGSVYLLIKDDWLQIIKCPRLRKKIKFRK